MGNKCCACLFNVNPTEDLSKKISKKTKKDRVQLLLKEDTDDGLSEEEFEQQQ